MNIFFGLKIELEFGFYFLELDMVFSQVGTNQIWWNDDATFTSFHLGFRI